MKRLVLVLVVALIVGASLLVANLRFWPGVRIVYDCSSDSECVVKRVACAGCNCGFIEACVNVDSEEVTTCRFDPLCLAECELHPPMIRCVCENSVCQVKSLQSSPAP